MKTAIIALTLFLLAQASQARVGETTQEINTRFGPGTKSKDRLSAPGVETFQYEKAGFTIEVVIFKGKSIWEIFQRKGQTISDDDIKELLKLYDTSSTSWRFDRRDSRWERSGKPKLIASRWPGHEDFFFIKDIEACETAEKKAKGSIKDL